MDCIITKPKLIVIISNRNKDEDNGITKHNKYNKTRTTITCCINFIEVHQNEPLSRVKFFEVRSNAKRNRLFK